MTINKDARAFLKRKQALLKMLLLHKRGMKKIILPNHEKLNVASLLKQVGGIQNIKELFKAENALGVSGGDGSKVSVKSKVFDSFRRVIVNPALNLKGKLALRIPAIKAKLRQNSLVSFFETVKQNYGQQKKAGRKEGKREFAYFKKMAKYARRLPNDIKEYMASRSEGESQGVSLFGKLAIAFGLGTMLVVGSAVAKMPQLEDVFKPLGLTGEQAESFHINTGGKEEGQEKEAEFTTVTRHIKGRNLTVQVRNTAAIQLPNSTEHQGDSQLDYLGRYVDGTTRNTLSRGQTTVAAAQRETSALIAKNSEVSRRYPDSMMRGPFGNRIQDLLKATENAAAKVAEAEKARRGLNQTLSYNGSETVTTTDTVYIGDSIAHGYRTASGGEGQTKVGASSKQVLGFVNNYSGDLRGKNVILSSGLSNSPNDMESIRAQIRALRARGANVRLLGVSNTFKGSATQGAAMNAALARLAREENVEFAGGFKAGSDNVHPLTYNGNYALGNHIPRTITMQAVAGATNNSSAVEQLKPMLRKHEGFSPVAKWDVNAFRLGYGSDTITNPDGSFRRVRQGDRVTREQAELDLTRRAREFLAGAEREIGSEHWRRLAPHVQAVLGSLKYNFGSLHNPRGGRGDLVPAIRNGASNEQIAAIIRGWQYKGLAANPNNKEAAGLRRRRNEEANYILAGGNNSTTVSQPVQQQAAAPLRRDRPLQRLQPVSRQRVQQASIRRTVDTTLKATLNNTPFMPDDERLTKSSMYVMAA